MPMHHALIVDDDADSASTLRELVAGERFTVAVAHTLRDARRQIALQQPDLILLDLQLPDGTGMDLFADPQLVANSEIVLITGHASLETSIEALRLGAADYLVKPIAMRQLEGVLARFMKPSALKATGLVPVAVRRWRNGLPGRAPKTRGPVSLGAGPGLGVSTTASSTEWTPLPT